MSLSRIPVALFPPNPPRSHPLKPQLHTACYSSSNSHQNPPATGLALKKGAKAKAFSTHVLKDEELKASSTDVLQEEEPLPTGLRPESMPRHVAIIMDGNGRWAEQRGFPAGSGPEAGFQAVREITNLSWKWGIRVLTFYMFSLDNYSRRTKTEVQVYMSLVEELINSIINTPIREGIRLSVIGDMSTLSDSLQKLVRDAEEKTKDNIGFQLILAVNYTGKYDVIQACKSIYRKVNDGLIQVEDINERVIDHELETKCTEFPCPDLLIRSSGELRLSNFMIWQLAYTEFYFTPALWPDFGKAEFAEALISFQQRKRRYGATRDS